MNQRELLFRCWDGKEMWKNLSLNSAYFSKETLKGIEVLQFTGLSDKNGVRIYEGDIVNDGTETGSIEFINGRWDFNGLEMFRYRTDFEVIGNIYENKDLLK